MKKIIFFCAILKKKERLEVMKPFDYYQHIKNKIKKDLQPTNILKEGKNELKWLSSRKSVRCHDWFLEKDSEKFFRKINWAESCAWVKIKRNDEYENLSLYVRTETKEYLLHLCEQDRKLQMKLFWTDWHEAIKYSRLTVKDIPEKEQERWHSLLNDVKDYINQSSLYRLPLVTGLLELEDGW